MKQLPQVKTQNLEQTVVSYRYVPYVICKFMSYTVLIELDNTFQKKFITMFGAISPKQIKIKFYSNLYNTVALKSHNPNKHLPKYM